MDEELQKKAKLRCMRLLERRDYTEKQLRDKLRMGKTQYTQEMIDGALEYVKSYRYVDDARYAAQYVECMKEKKSRRQIAQELYQKGISRGDVEAAFAQSESVPEETLILEWLEKRHFDPEAADLKETRKMYAFLARRGFCAESIKSALHLLDR